MCVFAPSFTLLTRSTTREKRERRERRDRDRERRESEKERERIFFEAILDIQFTNYSLVANKSQQVSELIPQLSAPFTNLAVVYEKKQDLKKAAEAYRKAMKKFPEEGEIALFYCRFVANLMNRKVSGRN